MAKFSRVFLGSAPLADTQRACKTEQQDERAKLVNVEPALLKPGDGTQKKVNVASFEETNILNILDDLRFIDVSTPQGASASATLQATHTLMFRCKMFIGDQVKDVEVLGRTTN